MSESKSLRRVLSATDLAALAVGSVIGSGIFRVPGDIAEALMSPGPILAAWVLVGLATLLAALTFAELANLFPEQGGEFVYLKEGYGPFVAFLAGWSALLLGFPAGSAGVSMISSDYLILALGLDPGSKTLVAGILLAVVAAITLLPTDRSFLFNKAMTVFKVAGIGALALLALLAGEADVSRLAAPVQWDRIEPAALGSAMVLIFWAYAGWRNLVVAAGESRRDGQALTSGLVLAIGVITGVYVLTNIGYLVVLPMDVLAGHPRPVEPMAVAALGPVGGTLFAWLVVLSTVSGMVAGFLAGSRYFFAMARAGLFFQFVGKVRGEGGAPWGGVMVQFTMATVLVATGSFRTVAGYFVAVGLAFMALTLASVFVFRRRMPDAERPYRVPLYPFVPLVAIGVMVTVLVSEVVRSPTMGWVIVGMLWVGGPVYWLWRRWVQGDDTAAV